MKRLQAALEQTRQQGDWEWAAAALESQCCALKIAIDTKDIAAGECTYSAVEEQLREVITCYSRKETKAKALPRPSIDPLTCGPRPRPVPTAGAEGDGRALLRRPAWVGRC
jgi:hypothetical protein